MPLTDTAISSIVPEESPIPTVSDVFSITPERPISSSVSSTEALPGKRLK